MGRGTVNRLPALLVLAMFLSSVQAMANDDRTPPAVCKYKVSRWNVPLKRSEGHQTVSHSYSRLAPDEIDSETGCTVCSEDQELIEVPPLEPFRLCWKIAPKVRAGLERLVRDGAPIFSVKGYVVIRSRGPLDADGNRTVFSNHSYGTALDINAQLNGLYDNCLEFGPWCRLVMGGPWEPSAPGALVPEGEIVRTFTSIGLKWGGEIEGRQKDFMHFSPTGY
ncbi:MAG: hypothetical protein A2X56_01795 [Nitrospirae bacterium GWC2_57_13]|nr:MAG: hypothetical protein A2X56_01795 [Nitrospirae bacterium GWC2_57_13]HAR46373.1 hypothetical protein [Nitrospiraceae bacterium]HAS54698.1 hypothetical protein [Nitrospiraceae bacterium]